jgi:hypothetical protein
MARAWPIEFRDNEELRLNRNGVWLSDGEEITHGETVRLFHRALKRQGDGFVIQVGRESKRVVVEDTPYFVVGLDGSADSGYWLRLSDETRERLDPATLKYGPSQALGPGRLVARVKGGTEEARFLSQAYFDLLSGLEEDSDCFFLVIGGKRIDLMDRISTFEDFWPYYVQQHSKPVTQWLHVAGALAALAVFALGLAERQWACLPAGIAAGYGLSWVGHFFFEKNKPATFQYPLWSFVGDLRLVSRKLLRKPLL